MLYYDISEFSSLLVEEYSSTPVLHVSVRNEDEGCPGCGLPRTHWTDNGGAGHRQDWVDYCCRGCCEGIGCTCVAGAESERHVRPGRCVGARAALAWPTADR
ncbi:MAG TPA: hypothetical protein VGM03_16240 [Phycisphaerae bacterium]